MIVIPAEGALVRDPLTRIALDGETEVDPNEPYWARLIVDGDVVAPPAPAPVATRRQATSSEDAV